MSPTQQSHVTPDRPVVAVAVVMAEMAEMEVEVEVELGLEPVRRRTQPIVTGPRTLAQMDCRAIIRAIQVRSVLTTFNVEGVQTTAQFVAIPPVQVRQIKIVRLRKSHILM